MLQASGLFIDGAAYLGTSGKTFSSLHPGSAEEIAKISIASQNDVVLAVESSQKAFLSWRQKSPTERGAILQKAAQLIRQRSEELAYLEALDTGKPITETRNVDIPSAADALNYFGGIAASLHGTHHSLAQGSFAYTRREPLGVCAGIGAWNYPLQIACWKTAPALACGNTMVYKPSELTPLSAIRLAEIFIEAGLPSGVFNVVQGGAEVGKALCEHPGVAKLSLTGSVATGKRVYASSAETLKHLTLELGGKSPLIICRDANLEQSVRGAMLANFFTQGEVCSNGTRVFVHESIKKEFIDCLIPRVKALRVGKPLDEKTQVGALISEEHRQKVLSFIQSGEREGARLLIGGTIPDLPGFFVNPAVFDDCSDHMEIVKEEIFGPVMCVLSFSDDEEVLKRANQTSFGLAAGVFTKDVQKAHRFAAELDVGICWINQYNITPVEIPFGGNKLSGLGRENGLAAIDHYTQLKTVYVEMGEIPEPFI